jgi:hypothetical protein
VRADQVDAEDRSVLLRDDLAHAAFADDVRLAYALHVELLHHDLVAALLGLRLGQPDRGDLR